MKEKAGKKLITQLVDSPQRTRKNMTRHVLGKADIPSDFPQNYKHSRFT